MAKKVEGGWLLNGSKIWTSYAHTNHFMVALVRTELLLKIVMRDEQVIVDLQDKNVTVSGIKNLSGKKTLIKFF